MSPTLSAYDAAVPELPGSVRVALWATRQLRDGGPLDRVAPRALPDVDHVDGLLTALEIWRDLGESAVLVALPSAGDTTTLPKAGPVATAAAVDAGEALYVPGIGGMLVPRHSSFGSSGRRVDWTSHDSSPVPAHRVEALSHSQLERELQALVTTSVERLTAAGGHPFADSMAREIAEDQLGATWGIPDSVSDRALRVIRLAGVAGTVARVGLEHSGALTAASAHERESGLRQLMTSADRILADATNAACAEIAGWVPAR